MFVFFWCIVASVPHLQGFFLFLTWDEWGMTPTFVLSLTSDQLSSYVSSFYRKDMVKK